jgi:hypothetical protein
MKSRFASSLTVLWLALHLGAVAIGAKEKAREETLILYDQRRVTLAVPEGFVYSSNKDERGMITARFNDLKEKITLQISFVPDPESECATPRGRKEVMVQSFRHLVADSVEKAMQFEELEPRSGAGTYCVLTDATLVGKASLPPGEYLQSTNGIKSWRGCFAIFTLLSQNTTSDDYRAAMKILRESLTEQPLTPLR